MMRIFFLLFFFSFTCVAQTTQNDSPYEISWAVDGPWVGGGLGLNALGLYLIQNKDALTDAELANLSKDDVFFLDKWAAGNYSNSHNELSYFPFYASFATPVIFLLNKNERNHAGQIMVLFVETMATTGAIYTLTAGTVQRSRPFVYNESLSDTKRKSNNSQRSFFAGHTAATASATFFAAKVYQDFNPDSPYIPYVWAGAAIIPASVAYLRTTSGNHFLTDNIIGYAIGAGVGILVPQLHKKGNENFSFFPTMGQDLMGRNYNAIHLSYRF
ncbi:MAG TPA: phosphatase PAP2 family protein [Salinimicrobium sp.]|nr:phosphatase PAP2 family protein [Salinimicrobium sp.]